MRRIVAVVLLVAFVLQATGSASATGIGAGNAIGAPGFRAEVGIMLVGMQNAISQSQIYALVSGNESAYNAIHAPQPDFSKIPRTVFVTQAQSRNIPHILGVSRGVGSEARLAVLPGVGAANSAQRTATVLAADRLAGTSILAARAITPQTCPLVHIQSQVGHRSTLSGCISPPPKPTATPGPTATPVPTATPSPTPVPTATPCPSGWLGSPPNCISPTPTPAPTATPPPALGTTTTGINPWWTYEEGGIPGVGKWMLNVANGNMIVQDDDIDIPERGIDLAFRRTYNSQSRHDYAGSDGSTPSNFGNGWTNTFDAHMSYNAATNVYSVYDIDGARYDYTCTGSPGALICTPPPGELAILSSDTSQGFFWTKKTGTTYVFYSPSTGVWPAGLSGRVYQIAGRNSNNNITFTYSWNNGDSTSAQNLTSIVAKHSDGQYLTLQFQCFPACTSGGHDLLASITRPDGQAVTFQYDSNANLTDVYDIGNNAATNANPIHHQYAWNANHQIAWANSADWVMSGYTMGAVVAFTYDTSDRATNVQYNGVVNFTPNDGTGQALQPGSTGYQTYRSKSFAYNSPTQTTYTDLDGHGSIYSFDSLGRVTQTQDSTGTQYLVSTATWDSYNNLVATVDPRGAATGNPSAYETDYAYYNGNMVEEALPAVSTSVGTIRPTSLYSYDQFNNVTAMCDPVITNQLGKNWTAPPVVDGSPLCPLAQVGAKRYTYDYSDTTIEPFGRLVQSESPCVGGGVNCAQVGETKTYTYNTAIQGGDFGLPTSVADTCFNNVTDHSQVCPQQSFTYDSAGLGNLVSYNNGVGTSTLTYDTNNRVTSVSDPDGITSRTCYEDDGSIQATQSAAQYGADGGVVCGPSSVAYTYDSDGNKLTELHHFGNVAGTTTNWYDGDDRLVEVGLPHDATDVYSYQWLTRNIYDISQDQSLTVLGVSGIYAHGNMYKTEEWLGGTPTWQDLKGDAYDAMDREVAHYQPVPGSSSINTTKSFYDESGSTAALLGQKTDALNESTMYAYDADGKVTNTSYVGDGGVTPSETVVTDPDARPVSITSSTMGTQTSQYDADGNVIAEGEASGGGVTSAAAYQYAYYPNGERASLSVGSQTLNQANMLQYAYRADGARTGLVFTDGTTVASMGWVLKPSGRVTTINDSSGYPGRALTYDAYGRVASDAMASGATSNVTYDKEGELTGYVPPSGGEAGAATIGYTVRGELASYTYAGTTCGAQSEIAPFQQRGANGYMAGADCTLPNNGLGPTYWDHRTDVALGSSTGDCSSNCSNSTTTFDAAGRESVGSQQWQVIVQGGSDTPLQFGGSGTETRSYDADNHTIRDVQSAWPSSLGIYGGSCATIEAPDTIPYTANNTLTYAWGPNGHPVLWGQSAASSSYTLHWDGDTPLFVTDSVSNIKEIKVESLGYYVPGGVFKFVDRNQSGFAVAAHWAGGTAPWAPADAYHNTCSGIDYSGSVLFEPGPDGISDGINVIQGVRTFSPGLGSWTTPDAYAGDASDPMSRRSYMWNNNNPLSYSDPSGYCPICIELGIDVVVAAAAEAAAESLAAGAIEAGIDMEAAGTLSEAAEGEAAWAQGSNGASTGVQNIAKSLFRGGEQEIPGGTAGAIRNELSGGGQTAGRFHLEKGANSIRAIKNLLAKGGLTSKDTAALKSMLDDLVNAFGKYNPDQFLNNNVPPPLAPDPMTLPDGPG